MAERKKFVKDTDPGRTRYVSDNDKLGDTRVPIPPKEKIADKVKAWLSIGANKWYAIGGVCALFVMFAIFGG